MKLRIIGAILFLGILICSFLLGEKVFALVMTIMAILGLKELIDIKYKKVKITYIKVISYLFLAIITSSTIYLDLSFERIVIMLILAYIIPIVFYNDKNKYSIVDACYFLGIVIFLSLSFRVIIEFRMIDIAKCIYIFIISSLTDTYAYIGGLLIGRHYFTDASPNKTIEGSIIGSFMGAIGGTLFYLAVIGDMSTFITVLVSFGLTIISQIGDLVFSNIKRYFGKKDFSNIIPGHGGILDRFDSAIFIALGMALIIRLF